MKIYTVHFLRNSELLFLFMIYTYQFVYTLLEERGSSYISFNFIPCEYEAS